jgi:hypothetical protein
MKLRTTQLLDSIVGTAEESSSIRANAISETKTTSPSASPYRKDPKDWIGWSEEPPYFDDEDIEEDTIFEFDAVNSAKTKFGYGGERGVQAQTTDIWTKRVVVVDSPSPARDSQKEEARIPSTELRNDADEQKWSRTEATPSSSASAPLPSTSQQQLLDNQSTLLLFIEMNRKFEMLERKLEDLQSKTVQRNERSESNIVSHLSAILSVSIASLVTMITLLFNIMD